jgi:putative photosynthetic complex assembly protein
MTSSIYFEPEPGARKDARPLAMPKPIGRMVAALALTGFALAVWGGLTKAAKRGRPPLAPVVASRWVEVKDTPDRGIAVHDAATGKLLASFDFKDGTFLRVTVRSMAGGRRLDPTKDGAKVLLTVRQNGDVNVESPAHDNWVPINAFGRSQVDLITDLIRTSGDTLIKIRPAIPTPRQQGS